MTHRLQKGELSNCFPQATRHISFGCDACDCNFVISLSYLLVYVWTEAKADQSTRGDAR
jgi:hypothetical protein